MIIQKIKELKYNLELSIKSTKIYDLYLEHKHRKQRAKRGWADIDLYSLDSWFQSTFLDMLNNFQIRTHGSPQEKFEEIDTFEKSWIKEQLSIIGSVPSTVLGNSNIANVSEVSLGILYQLTESKALEDSIWLREGIDTMHERMLQMLG